MKNILKYLPKAAACFFIVLFVYAAISKALDFENFQVQLAQSPLVSAYAGFISYSVIVIELIIAGLLLSERTRKIGLYLSLGMMVSFSIYIYLILNYSDFIPCSCGGILEKMSWNQHLLFNLGCVILCIISLYANNGLINHSRKLISINIGVISIFSAGIVIFLFLTSEHIIKKENNFIRRFPHHVIREDVIYDLKVNSYYFAGAVDDTVYLGNTTSPFLLTKIDEKLNSTKTTYINPNKKLKYSAPKITVSGQSFYLTDGYVPVIFRGLIHDPKGYAYQITSETPFFDQIKIIDSSTMVVRSQSSINSENILGLIKLSSPADIILKDDALEKQEDGIFDTDGQILYDDSEKSIYYFYYYKNEIVKFDTELNRIGRQKTIAQNTSHTPEIHTLKDGTKKIGVPSLPSNQNMIAYNGLVLTESNLMGKFEQSSQWRKNNIIDVYDLRKNEYWGSFYVPNPKKEKLHQMLIHKNHLYVLIGKKIVKYRIAQTLLDQFNQGKPKT